MYAIIEDGGKQYRVQKGDKIFVERRELAASAKTIEFDRVLMVGDGEKSKLGTPLVAGAKVTARLDDEIRGPKVDVVKFRRRGGYKRKQGHRQDYLKVTIDSITA
ncbi:MAG: 50S ribosomal protein L21 [Planctomycetota bacterium]|nr:MAG: 50S ribosomal protein L21 [Planctomycetota bacterium]